MRHFPGCVLQDETHSTTHTVAEIHPHTWLRARKRLPWCIRANMIIATTGLGCFILKHDHWREVMLLQEVLKKSLDLTRKLFSFTLPTGVFPASFFFYYCHMRSYFLFGLYFNKKHNNYSQHCFILHHVTNQFDKSTTSKSLFTELQQHVLDTWSNQCSSNIY